MKTKIILSGAILIAMSLFCATARATKCPPCPPCHSATGSYPVIGNAATETAVMTRAAMNPAATATAAAVIA